MTTHRSLRSLARRWYRLVVPAAVAVSALASCRGGGPPQVIVLGLDGMEPAVVDLLMSEGKLPHFARLRQEGAYGRFLSSPPLLSPVIWTTIATGKTPDQHGIGHFTAIDKATGEELPATSAMRRVKAVWNVLTEKKKKVDVVGWWATWPAETVSGAIVSDHLCYHFLFGQGATGASSAEGLTYPPELAQKLAPLVRRPSDVTAAEAAPFIHVTPEELARPFSFNDDVSHFKWALATADTYRRIGLKLLGDDRPDVLMVYTEATDSVAHLFGHVYRTPGLSGELLAQQKKFGDAVEQMYIYADRIVGDYMDAMGSNTTLLIMSDHGFKLGQIQDDPSKSRDMRRVSEQFHNVEGILYMYGNRVKPHVRLEQPKIVDITPTLLALMGLPAAQDMPGRVLTEGLDVAVPQPRIASYETGAPGTHTARDAAADPELLERLRSLGYLEGGEAPAKAPATPAADASQRAHGAPDTRSPTGDRNIAAVEFEQGHFEQSARLYERLLKDSPSDASLMTSLAGALGAMGRYDEADRYLASSIKLQPLNVEAYHNRGVIQERKGNKPGAIEQYRLALRYNPQYAPSRQALSRLTGSAEVEAPRNAAEKKAYDLAQSAADLARRGDYAGAMKNLDDAERLAPSYALVHQYRSNVAYLMGDVPGAIRALQKGLKLEPSNALFQANLKWLAQQQQKKQPAAR